VEDYSSRRRRRRRGPWTLIVLVIGLLSCLFLAASILWYDERPSEKPAPLMAVKRPATSAPPQPAVDPARVRAVNELDARIEIISRAHVGTQGAFIFDPYSGTSASLNADRRFVAASLSKLYALLTLYRAAAKGELSLDDEITMRASDVWAEGTGVLYRYPVGHTMTLRECATFLIKESDNTAEVMLNRYLGEEEIEDELDRIGAHSTSYWMPNITTPNDILLVLKAIADPSYTSPELSAEMLDIMTNTSFEDRLPPPLPEGTRVAHKIGSYESTFSDAGLIFPEGAGGTDQAYYVVVFSEGATEGEARQAIQEVSLAAYRALASPDER
jgi:beta-lactamase class A